MATSSASTIHVRKRPYQPSITAFFDRNAEKFGSQRRASPLSPPQPAETQASLLSVGMRIRKSVPEGYKTHKTLGSPGFPFPSTAPSASTVSPPTLQRNDSSRELIPFCGLHKIGGWASQPEPLCSAPAAMTAINWNDDEERPHLSKSQSTVQSTQDSLWSGSGRSQDRTLTKKRSYEEEVEEELDAYFEDVEATESSRAKRLFARPKSFYKQGLHNALTTLSDNGDFEEASFLVPMEGVEVDHGEAWR